MRTVCQNYVSVIFHAKMAKSDFLIKLTCVAVLSEVVYHFINGLYQKLYPKRFVPTDSLTASLIETLSDDKPTEDRSNSGTTGFHKVLFFPDSGLICKKALAGRECKLTSCPYVHDATSLSHIIKVVNMAKHSIDICMYLITSPTLSEMVIDAHRRGLTVRVITDDKNSGEDTEVAGAQVGRLRAEGILVRCSSSSFWMHHKFVILDNEVLINGSLNWTNSAVLGNFENVLITTEKMLVLPYTQEFSRLWKLLEPKVSL